MLTSIQYNDEELVLMMEQKDHHALSFLYDKYAAAVFGAIIRDVGNIQMAEEILQRSFMTIWNKASFCLEQERLLITMLKISRAETTKMLGEYPFQQTA